MKSLRIFGLIQAVLVVIFAAVLYHWSTFTPHISSPTYVNQHPLMQEQEDYSKYDTERFSHEHFQTGVSLQDFGNVHEIAAFEHDSRSDSSILEWYQAWGAKNGSQNFPTKWLDTIYSIGMQAMITWESWYSLPFPQDQIEPDYTLSKIIHGKYDAFITAWAKASKAWDHPYYLRLDLEMNGDWIPWIERTNGNTYGQFVAMWRHVHHIFTEVGATKVQWVWTPNVENYTQMAPMSIDYPGDAYVNWVGMDGFNWGTDPYRGSFWTSFKGVFNVSYQDLLHIAPNKPMMIAETGSSEEGGNKAAWITDAYSIELPLHFPKVKSVIWFNEVSQRDWRIETSPQAQLAFQDVMRLPWMRKA